MALSFIRGKKVGAPPKYAGSKKGDPLTAAKAKVIDALKVQKGYAQLVSEGKPVPKTDGGREASTWFYREIDGTYWTTLRYGQLSIPLRAVQRSQLTLHLDRASSPARAAAYLSWLNVLA